ncbi:MAG: hypothetical protein IJV31_10290 [Clostridia bacterium]|nr:hypothetical protein [Clostridia bacterium]
MVKLIVRFVCLLLILLGVILVYDARIITKELFGFGDQNEASSGLKILGAIICILGVLIMLFI